MPLSGLGTLEWADLSSLVERSAGGHGRGKKLECRS